MFTQGFEAYASETDPDVIPVPMTMVGKRVEKKLKISRVAADDEESDRLPMRPRKSTILIRRKPRIPLKLSVPYPTELPREIRPLDLDRKMEKAKKMKKKKRKALFVPPCKGEICKPKVCCWRPGVKAGKKRRSKGERKPTVDSAVSVRPTDKWRRRGKESKALREMRAPPTVLREELLKAMAEIQMAKKSKVRLPVEAR